MCVDDGVPCSVRLLHPRPPDLPCPRMRPHPQPRPCATLMSPAPQPQTPLSRSSQGTPPSHLLPLTPDTRPMDRNPPTHRLHREPLLLLLLLLPLSPRGRVTLPLPLAGSCRRKSWRRQLLLLRRFRGAGMTAQGTKAGARRKGPGSNGSWQVDLRMQA